MGVPTKSMFRYNTQRFFNTHRSGHCYKSQFFDIACAHPVLISWATRQLCRKEAMARAHTLYPHTMSPSEAESLHARCESIQQGMHIYRLAHALVADLQRGSPMHIQAWTTTSGYEERQPKMMLIVENASRKPCDEVIRLILISLKHIVAE